MSLLVNIYEQIAVARMHNRNPEYIYIQVQHKEALYVEVKDQVTMPAIGKIVKLFGLPVVWVNCSDHPAVRVV